MNYEKELQETEEIYKRIMNDSSIKEEDKMAVILEEKDIKLSKIFNFTDEIVKLYL